MREAVYRVFISYKRKTGEDFALHLKEGLDDEQISAFLDIKDIPKKLRGKSEWRRFRDEAIYHSEVFLLIITDGIETSSEVVNELTYANKIDVECVFLRHKGLQPKIILNHEGDKIDLGDFNQTEFETKEDLLRRVLRILKETSRADSLREKAIPVNSPVFTSEKKNKGKLEIFSTEEIVGRLEDHEVDFLRGRWFLKKSNYERALTLFDRSLAFKPDFVPCLIEKGIALGSLEKHEESITWFDKAIAVDPTSFIAYALKGTALHSVRKYEDAIENYDKSIELKPMGHAYYNKAHALDDLGRYSEAVTCYEKAIEISPTDASYWHNKAFALFKLKRYDESIASCDKALSIAPIALSWALKGEVFVSLEKMAEARNCYDLALKIEARPSILIGLSEVQLIMGDAQEGLATADRAFHLSKTPSDRVFSWFLRIAAYYLDEKTEKARIEMSRLLEFLKLEKDVEIPKDIPLSLIHSLEKRLRENDRSFSSLVSLFRGDIQLEDFLKGMKDQ